MLLYDPGGTPLDLRFRLFGTNVRVHPMFWLISAILGWNWSRLGVLPGNGLGEVLVWVLCSFFSILLHEFGHVWMGRVFGARGHIVLYGMGGLAIGSADVPYRWQRILVSAAGPVIQLLLFGALMGLMIGGVIPAPGGQKGPMGIRPANAYEVALLMLLLINFFWPLLNLLPIWPLDGGYITRDLCGMIAPRQGTLISLWISLVVAGALCANSILLLTTKRALIPYVGDYFGGLYMAIFFGMFAISAFQAIQEERRQRRRYWEDDDELPWER